MDVKNSSYVLNDNTGKEHQRDCYILKSFPLLKRSKKHTTRSSNPSNHVFNKNNSVKSFFSLYKK